jgi:glycosyltransferase involved in cell wall biosynthesis
MKFEILIATMNGKILPHLGDIPCAATVINQSCELSSFDRQEVKVRSFDERGLSASRNRALSLASADICLIADDDVKFCADIDEHIVRAFEQHPTADIITFQVLTPDGSYFKDNYASAPFWHTKKTLMRVCSIEIAFRRRALSKAGLQFDLRFGLGGQFPTGEEIIFLTDALARGLKILYVPFPVAIHPKESSGASLKNNPKLIKAKGAMFHRMFGHSGYFVCALFAHRKHRESGFGFLTFCRHMFAGISEYKKR